MQARHEDLVAWQRAMKLAEEIDRVTQEFPSDERFGMVAQMRPTGASAHSNIAEGHGKATASEFGSAMGHARGPLCELRTQLKLATHLGFFVESDHAACIDEADQVGRLISGLIAPKAQARERLTSDA